MIFVFLLVRDALVGEEFCARLFYFSFSQGIPGEARGQKEKKVIEGGSTLLYVRRVMRGDGRMGL